MMGTTSYQPKVAYRVLATDWDGEAFTECWTRSIEDATTIARKLQGPGVDVQIDKVVSNPKRTDGV